MKSIQEQKNWETTVSKLIAKAWLDNQFYDRFVSNPTQILREAGLALENFAKVILNQDSTTASVIQSNSGGVATLQINLPAKPVSLSDEQVSILNQSRKDIVPIIPICCC